MRVRKYASAIPNRILAAMVLDDVVACRISAVWREGGLFESSWSNLIAKWCIEFTKQYNKAPKKQIVSIFEKWVSEGNKEDELIETVEKFLVSLSDKYGSPDELGDTHYLLDLAGEYFNKIALGSVKKQIELGLEIDASRGAEALNGFSPINLGKRSFLELAEDPTLHIHAYDQTRRKELIYYDGRLGRFLNNAFYKGTFYAIMAPDKAGKSMWLIDMAWRALRNRCKVLFFDTGDSIEEEVIERFGQRALQRPIKTENCKIPVEWKDEELSLAEEKREGIDPIEAFRKIHKTAKSSDALKISVHSSNSISAEDIRGMVIDLDRGEDWRPDVVIVDYADILASPRGVRDKLDQIDETWMQLRRLSQDQHCLVLTATQVSASAYGKEGGLLSKKHFSGRKTKLAHVNGMLGYNVSSEEKEEGMARINWIVRRRAYYNEKHFCRIAGCPAIGCPVIISC